MCELDANTNARAGYIDEDVNGNVLRKSLKLKSPQIDIRIDRNSCENNKENYIDEESLNSTEIKKNEPLGLTVGIGGGWQKRGTGHSYNSLSGKY